MDNHHMDLRVTRPNNDKILPFKCSCGILHQIKIPAIDSPSNSKSEDTVDIEVDIEQRTGDIEPPQDTKKPIEDFKIGATSTIIADSSDSEAQSEAPSVNELENILDRLAVRMYDEGQLDKPSLMGRQVAIVNINEAKAKINRLILGAYNRGYSHGHSVGYDEGKIGFQPDSAEPELSNNLSKGGEK